MKTGTIATAFALLLTGSIATAESVHNPQAIEHTKAAITEGSAGHAGTLLEHAEVALTHAQASQKAEPSVHTEEAISHLNAAVEAGKQGNGVGLDFWFNAAAARNRLPRWGWV